MVQQVKRVMTKEPTRVQIVLWVVIMLVLLAVSLYDWSGYQVGTYGDDGSYIANADSLIQRVPYGTLLVPNENEQTQFPFLFPLLLTPIRAIAPASLDALRLVPLVATLLAMTVLFWGWRYIAKGLSYWWALGTVAITALSPLTILHARTVMSEGVFLFFSLLLIVWVEYIVEKKPRAWGILFGILGVCMIYTRAIGWLFLAIWVAYLIWKLRGAVWQQLSVGLLSAAAILALVLTMTTVQAIDLLPQEYIADFSNIVKPPPPVNGVFVNDTGSASELASQDNKAARRNYPLYVAQGILFHLDIADKLPLQLETVVKDWTDRNGLYFLRILPALLGLVLAGLGIVVWIRHTGVTAFQVMVPPYVLTLLLWSWQGPRLIYPIQPQIFLTLLLGTYTAAGFITSRIPPRALKTIWATGATASLLVLLLGASIWIDSKLSSTMFLGNDMHVRAAYVSQNVPENGIVLDTRAVGDRLYVPRTYIDVPFLFASTPELVAYLQRHHVEYIVAQDGLNPTEQFSHVRTSQERRFLLALQPLIDAGHVETLYQNHAEDIAIFRIDATALAIH